MIRSHCWWAGLVAVLCCVEPCWSQSATTPRGTNGLTLRQAIENALLENRALQIERINPEIARLTLGEAYGYYDPIIFADGRRETASDTGGFDPADFSADAIYEAESYITTANLTGYLPTGMRYTLSGDYANATGTRNAINFDSHKIKAGISVQQPLLRNFWVDSGRNAIRVGRKDVSIARLGVVYLTMDIVNQVHRAYNELLYAHENLRIRYGLVTSRADMLSGTQRKIDQGTATAPEIHLARAQLSTSEADWLTASNALVLAGNTLRGLMGGAFHPGDAAIVQPAESLLILPERFDLSDSYRWGLARRPDLLQLREDKDRAAIDLKYRRNQLFPSLDIVAGYGRRGASIAQTIPPFVAEAPSKPAFDQVGHGLAPNDLLGVIFSMPLSRAAERANYRAGKKLREQVTLLLRQREELVLREITDAVSNARSSLLRVEAARQTREYSESALQAEERKLTGGASTVFFVLQLQNDLVASLTAEARAKADYNIAVSQLRFAEGRLLDTDHIIVDME